MLSDTPFYLGVICLGFGTSHFFQNQNHRKNFPDMVFEKIFFPVGHTVVCYYQL